MNSEVHVVQVLKSEKGKNTILYYYCYNTQVEYFISGEYAGVCYDDSLQPIYYSSSDFDKSECDLEELKRTLITLRKNKYYDITDAQRSVLLTDLTRYPSIFIKEVNQHIR